MGIGSKTQVDGLDLNKDSTRHCNKRKAAKCKYRYRWETDLGGGKWGGGVLSRLILFS